MPRRFGFWALLITSALWAQGCAHTSSVIDTTQRKSLEDLFIGTWSCTDANETFQDGYFELSGYSKKHVTRDEIHEDGIIIFTAHGFMGDFTNPATSEIKGASHGTYEIKGNQLLTKMQITQFEVTKSSKPQMTIFTNLLFKDMPKEMNESVYDILKLDEHSLVLKKVEEPANLNPTETCTR